MAPLQDAPALLMMMQLRVCEKQATVLIDGHMQLHVTLYLKLAVRSISVSMAAFENKTSVDYLPKCLYTLSWPVEETIDNLS